jgi:hypothetical protein
MNGRRQNKEHAIDKSIIYHRKMSTVLFSPEVSMCKAFRNFKKLFSTAMRQALRPASSLSIGYRWIFVRT